MRQYWRIQQSQTLISMGFWTATLTLLIWPYVSWRFEADKETLGIAMTYWGLASIAVGVLVSVLAIGFIYDHFLALWKEQRTVDTERNPFGTYALIPANVVMIGMMNRLLRDKADGDEQVLRTCDWVDEWLDWCSSQEIWARRQRFWDSEFENQVPNLFFLPDDAVEKARAVKLDD